MSCKRYCILILCLNYLIINADGLDFFKGIGSDIKNFPLFKGSFWTGLGRSFGAPPTGYVYSFSVYNDTDTSIWIGIQEMVSIMGGTFPKAGGWSVIEVTPFSHHSVENKEYYFEILIKSTPSSYASHMPYMQHKDVLYMQDVIQLQQKHSTQQNYFRAFYKKELQNGVYLNVLKAEYLGYSNPANKNDKGATISLSSALSSLTIENSTSSDYFVGYNSQPSATAMTKESCSIFAKVEKNSFALLNAAQNQSLRPGTIGVFDIENQKLLKAYDLGAQGFEGKPYTLNISPAQKQSAKVISKTAKIVQEGSVGLQIAASAALNSDVPLSVSADSQQRVETAIDESSSIPMMSMQGLMPGNYDLPAGRVRDITPVSCVFWYQSAAGQKGMYDLPGKVWIVAMDLNQNIMLSVQPGIALQFNINRPEIGKKLWLYFIYINADETKARLFLQKLITGKIGADVLEQYQIQAKNAVAWSKQRQTAQTIEQAKANQAVTIPKELLIQAVQGALSLNQGQIQDATLGVTAYLLGADVFLSQGIGALPVYYQLAPSSMADVPVHGVYNSFASSTPPPGLPALTQAQLNTQVVANPGNAKTVKKKLKLVKLSPKKNKTKAVNN